MQNNGASVPDQAGRAAHGASISVESPPSGDHPSRLAKLTPAEKRAISALAKPLHPREFARIMWPDSDGWRNNTNCGRGVSVGGGMRLAAGGLLGKLRKKHPDLFVWHVHSGSATGLTALGQDVRRAIAMEARQGGDRATGLHPKDDSAGAKHIAQQVDHD